MMASFRRFLDAMSGKSIPDSHVSKGCGQASATKATPESLYFGYLAESNRHLSLRGLLHGHIPRIRLDQIYVSLKAIAGDPGERGIHSTTSLQEMDGLPEPPARTQLADTSFYERQNWIVSKVGIEQLLSAHARTAILGEPGSGKTTFVRYLVAKMVAEGDRYGRELGLPNAATPIPIALRRVDPARLPGRRGIGELCVPEVLREDVSPTFIASLIDRGSCVFIFDGLDEVTDASDRRRVANWIEDLANSFGMGNRFIVTSRIVGYRDAPLGAGFEKFTLCDFDIEDIRSFVHRWYEAVASTVFADDPHLQEREVAARSEKLLDVMNSKPGIQELAHNPLLLTIVLLVYSNRASLPEERGKLYSECIDVLLEHLQQSRLEESYHGAFRPIQQLTLDQRRDLLKTIARWLHESGVTHEDRELISRAAIDPVLPGMGFGPETAELFLKEVEERSGLLVQRSGGLGFSHLAFQEFLTALCLAQDEKEELAIPMLIQVRFRSWWREIIQLYATLVSDASWLLRDLISAQDSRYAHNVLLAGACLADARRVRELSIRQDIIARLLELYTRSSFSFHRRHARELLVRIGGPQVEEPFTAILAAPNSDVLLLLDAVEVLSRIRLRGGTVRNLLLLISGPETPEQVRLAALRGMRNSGEPSDELRKILFDLIFHSMSPALRQEAVATLGQLFTDDATVEQIRATILEAPSYTGSLDDFYVSALKAFIGHLPLDRALKILDEKLAIAQAAEFKVEVCRSLLLVRRDEAQRIEKLIQMLKSGIDWGVRGGAALLLGLSHTDRREIAHVLVERLAVDKELGVGLRIADALAHLGWRDQQIIEGLRRALQEDSHSPTLRKLIEAFATLTRDEGFIRERIVSVLENASASSTDQVEAFALLARLHYQSEDITRWLVRELDSMRPERAKACLRYLTAAATIPPTEIATMRRYLETVLANDKLDSVLRDCAFEAMFDLFGIGAAETAVR
jgi:hypothetical protein